MKFEPKRTLKRDPKSMPKPSKGGQGPPQGAPGGDFDSFWSASRTSRGPELKPFQLKLLGWGIARPPSGPPSRPLAAIGCRGLEWERCADSRQRRCEQRYSGLGKGGCKRTRGGERDSERARRQARGLIQKQSEGTGKDQLKKDKTNNVGPEECHAGTCALADECAMRKGGKRRGGGGSGGWGQPDPGTHTIANGGQ